MVKQIRVREMYGGRSHGGERKERSGGGGMEDRGAGWEVVRTRGVRYKGGYAVYSLS